MAFDGESLTTEELRLVGDYEHLPCAEFIRRHGHKGWRAAALRARLTRQSERASASDSAWRRSVERRRRPGLATH